MAPRLRPRVGGCPRRDQLPTVTNTSIANNAADENQALLDWPLGITISAARIGPIAGPILPPTWNKDCARPCRPPEAILAMRDASGWNTAEPVPTRAAAGNSTRKFSALARS